MKKVLLAACAVAFTVGGLSSLGVSPAAADTAATGNAAGYGLNAEVAGISLVNQAGAAVANLPPGQDTGPNALVLVPAAPVAVAGTATGGANAHAAADLQSSLVEVSQAVPGPYNVRGIGLVQGLGVLLGPAPLDPALDLRASVVSASAVRGEAVGVCRGGNAVYSANSEIANLNVGGAPLGLNAPITGLLDTLNTVLAPLNQIVSIQRNEVVVTTSGASVNALHVTVLSLLGAPVLDLIVGHAQVSGLQCPPPPPTTTTTSPAAVLPRTAVANLPRTGGDQSTTLPVVGGLALLGLGALVLRRRSQAAR